MSQQIMTIVSILQKILAEAGDVGDKEYLSKKQFDGKLFKEISAEFTGDAVQISHIVPAGKTFYLVSAKLYPVVDTIKTGFGNGPSTPVTENRRADVELAFDGALVDVLTHDMETSFGNNSGGVSQAMGNAGQAGQYDTNIIDSFDGDGVKVIELTSTNTSGTYRVSLMGFEEDTGTDPTLLAQSITVEASVAGDTGDLAFLQERILSGNVFEESGDINTLTSTIEFIVPNGKTAFMVEAKIIQPDHTTAAGSPAQNQITQKNIVTAALKIDGVIKDKTIIGEVTVSSNNVNQFGGGTGTGYGNNGDGKFNVKTLSLVGDGVKKIEIENTLDDGNAFASMSGYLIDT